MVQAARARNCESTHYWIRHRNCRAEEGRGSQGAGVMSSLQCHRRPITSFVQKARGLAINGAVCEFVGGAKPTASIQSRLARRLLQGPQGAVPRPEVFPSRR